MTKPVPACGVVRLCVGPKRASGHSQGCLTITNPFKVTVVPCFFFFFLSYVKLTFILREALKADRLIAQSHGQFVLAEDPPHTHTAETRWLLNDFVNDSC